MAGPRDDGIRIGGPRDPVAQSIRRQQQNDAMPSAAEAKREHRKRLASEGCEVCGDDDPDRLTRIRIPFYCCRNDQMPDPPFETTVLCDEHERDASTLGRARIVQKARQDDADVVAIYDCGAATWTSWDVPDTDELGRHAPHMADMDFDDLRMKSKVRVATPPQVDAFHVGRGCGATLDEVINLDA